MGLFRRKKQAEPETRSAAAPANAAPIGAGLVRIAPDGTVSYRATSVAEARLAIKELKLHKKDLATRKREVQAEINAITGERRDQLAAQGRMVPGKHLRPLRHVQGFARDMAKAEHEARLAPYQARKADLERRANLIDRAILQAEAYFLRQDTSF